MDIGMANETDGESAPLTAYQQREPLSPLLQPIVPSQLAHPDVPVTHRTIVIL
jgi:hypothetical protein